MANVSMKAKELGNGVMVCMSVDTKHLQDAIDKADIMTIITIICHLILKV